MKESRIKDINLHIERFKSTQQIKERPTLSTILSSWNFRTPISYKREKTGHIPK